MTMIAQTEAKPNRKLVLSRETVRLIGGASDNGGGPPPLPKGDGPQPPAPLPTDTNCCTEGYCST